MTDVEARTAFAATAPDAPRRRKGSTKAKATKIGDRWFDQGLTAEGEALRGLAEPLAAAIDRHQRSMGSRKNQRGADAQAAFEARVGIVTANLAYAVIRPHPTGRIAVPLRKRALTRYDNALLKAEHLSPILDSLKALGVIGAKQGGWAGPMRKGKATTIAPSPEFASEVEAHGLTLADFGRWAGQEVLLLKAVKPKDALAALAEHGGDGDDAPLPTSNGHAPGRRTWVNYPETPETTRLRDQVKALCRFIADADLRRTDGVMIDKTDRLLRRHFNQSSTETTPRFDLGGRLFHRTLSRMKRDERRHLVIEGRPVIGLDYASMFARLAYARVNTPAPEGDLYGWHGLGSHRAGVKQAFNAMLFGGGRGEAFPSDIRSELPRALSPAAFRQAFTTHHPALIPLLTEDAGGRLPIGFALMHVESQIMATVLERLMAMGVVAIGLHDGLLVGDDHERVALEVMTETAREVAGIAIPVQVKQAWE